DSHLPPKHELLALLGGLDRLRRELRLGGDECDVCGEDISGHRIEDDARLIADRKGAGDPWRHEDRQIDVAEVEERENPTAGVQYLLRLRKFVLDTAPTRGNKL